MILSGDLSQSHQSFLNNICLTAFAVTNGGLALMTFSAEKQMPQLIAGEQPLMPALLIISDASQFLLMVFCLETAWLGGHLKAILSSCDIGIAYIDSCHV